MYNNIVRQLEKKEVYVASGIMESICFYKEVEKLSDSQVVHEILLQLEIDEME